MSGFRTPHYNHAIGNVKYSRHQWGGAADIFVDASPRDGVMDDLDGNGRSDDGDGVSIARKAAKPRKTNWVIPAYPRSIIDDGLTAGRNSYEAKS